MKGSGTHLARNLEMSRPSYMLVSGMVIGHLKNDNLSGLAGVAAALCTTLSCDDLRRLTRHPIVSKLATC